MKTIIVPQPIYHTISESLFEDQDKENQTWVYLKKRKAIQKARKMAEDQHKKVTDLMKLINNFQ